MSNELDSILESSFDAVSVLLVFLTVLFSIRYPEILNSLNEPLSFDKPKLLKRQKSKIKNNLIFKWVPVVFLNIVIVYLLTPLGIKVINNSSLSIINFNFIRTSYVLIWYLNIAYLFTSIYLMLQIFYKLSQKRDG